MIFLKERIGKLADNLQALIYKEEIAIKGYKICKSTERFADIANLDTSAWETFLPNQLWGGNYDYYWFETVITIPKSFDGACVVYEILTGCEDGWDAINPQFAIYVNGYLKQGVDINHREILLTEKAEAGQQFCIVLSAFTGTNNFSIRLDSKIKILDRLTEKYFYDISVPLNVAKLLPSGDKDYITIILKLNESLNLLDLRKPYSKEYYKSLEEASDYITNEFYQKLESDGGPVVYCVGHTHIDCAWLWTLAVTEDKVVRSFSTVLELMREYPEYIFMSSQPQLYQYMKKNAPEKYEEIKERVAEGRWETDGGMFVEADCNVSSGESLVRQFMFGKRFFKEEFGKENSILWLPDVFGYSAALPQIMQKCNLPYFMTTKISWNEFNKMPYDTFEWEGIDGSRVLTHFIPTKDYEASGSGGCDSKFFTTYNGMINPSQIKGGWERYSQKHLNNEVLNSFGYGDGGGGPTKDMLENQRRLAKGIPGCPRTVMSTAKDFFDRLEDQVKDNKYLPSWVGELYLEYHRGTYTSMARNKKYNRKSEFAYQNAELYSVLNKQLRGGVYPKEAINDGWEVILRNQFHDILPGSSIKEVYDDSKVEYEGILKSNHSMVNETLKALAADIDAPKSSIIVYNANSGYASGIVQVDYTFGSGHLVACSGKERIPLQQTGEESYVFRASNVPSKGYKTYQIVEGSSDDQEEMDKGSPLQVSLSKMENPYLILEFNEKGQIGRLYDKKANREILKQGASANVIMTYEDMPHNYDAWDVNNYYTEKSWEVDQVESIEVIEKGPIRACVKIVRGYLDSIITQYIYMYLNSPRIDIKSEIDWKEGHIFMKALFPVDVHTSEATFDIQYGNVKRATHYNTSWDMARFEVCVNKWLDVSEDGYGVSMLNDCKYGCSVHDGVIGVSMLKSATYPNPEADKEFHEFTYSIYPHTGDWKAAGTVVEAYQLNNPLEAMVKENAAGALEPEISFVHVDQENVVIEVVKKAEDSEDIIVRLYECYNRRSEAVLTFYQDIKEIYECNLMEEEDVAVEFDGKQAGFRMKPYEIKTFKVKFTQKIIQ